MDDKKSIKTITLAPSVQLDELENFKNDIEQAALLLQSAIDLLSVWGDQEIKIEVSLSLLKE